MAFALTAVLGLVGLVGCGAGHRAASPAAPVVSSGSSGPGGYGQLPSFLPSSALQPDSVLTGTAGRPALTTEGDDVDVLLGALHVRARVTGPDVPGEGLPFETPTTTCTWTVTLSGASAAVPISLADFTTLDHLGKVYRVVAVPHQPAPPTVLPAGRTVSFQVRSVMPTGEGLMRWAPDGHQIVASWDFEVEND